VLDTGVARDVSGVFTVTGDVGTARQRRSDVLGVVDDGDGTGDEGKDQGANGLGKEFLYFVKGDGSVKVFERGSGDGH
jgi:elongator complex protein 6